MKRKRVGYLLLVRLFLTDTTIESDGKIQGGVLCCVVLCCAVLMKRKKVAISIRGNEFKEREIVSLPESVFVDFVFLVVFANSTYTDGGWGFLLFLVQGIRCSKYRAAFPFWSRIDRSKFYQFLRLFNQAFLVGYLW